MFIMTPNLYGGRKLILCNSGKNDHERLWKQQHRLDGHEGGVGAGNDVGKGGVRGLETGRRRRGQRWRILERCLMISELHLCGEEWLSKSELCEAHPMSENRTRLSLQHMCEPHTQQPKKPVSRS